MHEILMSASADEAYLSAWREERRAAAAYYQAGNGSALMRAVGRIARRIERVSARIEAWTASTGDHGRDTGRSLSLR